MCGESDFLGAVVRVVGWKARAWLVVATGVWGAGAIARAGCGIEEGTDRCHCGG